MLPKTGGAHCKTGAFAPEKGREQLFSIFPAGAVVRRLRDVGGLPSVGFIG
jgi:hypothetical protein